MIIITLFKEDNIFSTNASLTYGPGHAKTCLMSYANNKGAGQHAHTRSLISTFVFAA